MHRYYYAVAGVLAILAWNVPNHVPPWTAFYNESLAVAALLTAAVGTSVGRITEKGLEVPVSACFITAIALVPLLQFGYGIVYFFGDALIASLYLAVFGLTVIVGANLQQRHPDSFLPGFSSIIVLSALVSTFLAAHQWLGLDGLGMWLADARPDGRQYANLGQPNNLATFLCLGLAASLYLYERQQIGKLPLVAIALVLAAGVAMTRSRTGVLSLLALAFFVTWSSSSVSLRIRRWETWTGTVAALLLWLGWPTLSERLLVRSVSSFDRIGAALSGDSRLDFWRQLSHAVLEGPISGYGWNQVSVAQVAVADRYASSSFTEHSHNFVLDLFVWNGPILGSALVVMVLWWLLSRVRRIESRESWAAFTGILVVGVHAMLEFPLEYSYLMIPVAIFVGVVEIDSPVRTVVVVPRMGSSLFVLACCVVGGAVAFDYLKVESQYRSMRMETAGIGAVDVKRDERQVLLLDQHREYMRLALAPAREGMSDDELERMRRVVYRFAFPPALMRYALALGLNGKYDDAALALRRLRGMHGAKHSEEAFDAWSRLAATYPQLRNVPLNYSH